MAKLPTLILALLILHFALGGLCLAATRGENRMVSVRYWGWGLIAYAAGLLITILPSVLTRPVASGLGNIVIAYAPIPFIQGVLNNTRRRLDWRWTGTALSATVLVILANNGVGPELRLVNLVAPSPIAIGLFLYAGLVLWQAPVPAARGASCLLAAVLLFCSALWSLRIAMLLGAFSAGPSDPARTQLIIDLFSIAQILTSVIGMLCLFWIEVLKMEETLKSMAYGDSLTGLANRRATVMRFEEQASLARRTQRPFTVMLFDIDFFKKVNDTYGHQAGDAVLKHIAAILTSAKRQEDLLGRIGGEEFVLLLANTDMEGARVIADRMRELVAHAFLQHEGRRIAITISGGLAQFPEDGDSWDRIFSKADERLYQAKADGRNRITAAG
jgi:diguanylate cyclase (GGDEF)-like protein